MDLVADLHNTNHFYVRNFNTSPVLNLSLKDKGIYQQELQGKQRATHPTNRSLAILPGVQNYWGECAVKDKMQRLKLGIKTFF